MKCLVPSRIQHRQAGFTLVELSMSLIFIAFIMLFLTSTMLSIMGTYNKGVWMNQINQASRQINSDISDQAQFSSNLITISTTNQRLCIGNVAYLWNTAADVATGGTIHNWFSDEVDGTGAFKGTTNLRFVRVTGSDASQYCSPGSTKLPDRNDSNTTILLGSGVVVQRFDVTQNATTRLLRIHTVFSTGGDVQPHPETDASGVVRWQCDVHNQFCAFTELNLIVYGRIGI